MTSSPTSSSTSPTRATASFFQRTNTHCMAFLFSIQSYLVEVAYFMFFLARHMSLPLFQEYVQSEVYKQNNLKLSLDRLGEGPSPNETVQLKMEDANKESTLLILSLQIAEGLPAVIAVIILGAVSDRTGRRRIMLWLPALGSVVHSLIFVLVMYTGWTLDGMFMASAIRGISGSMTAFLAGGSYYAINIVKPHQRSSRLALQELLNGAAYAIGNIMVGYWVKASGFLQPFWFTLICSLIAFLISFFLVQELKTDQSRAPREPSTDNCCIDTFKPMVKFFKCRNNLGLVRIWLAILAFQTYAIVHIGQINILVIYLLGQPMAWPVSKIGVFLSVAMAFAAMSTGVVPPFLRSHFSDTQIAFAGFFSKAVGTLWLAIMHNETVLYFGILLLVLELLPFPMMRAIVAKGIDPGEQGSLFALMHCGESVSYFLAPLVFQSIYAASLTYYSGFVFIVSIILLILPVAFTIGIRYIDLRDPAQYVTMDGDTELIPSDEATSISEREATSPRTDNGAIGNTTSNVPANV